MKILKTAIAIMLSLALILTSTAAADSVSDEPLATPPNAPDIPPPDWLEENSEEIPPDLLGNAELIDSQKVVFESDIISFISVTTKAGNVFYILIDHRITDGGSSVYFLTKVNEYDLLSLLYVPSENDNEDNPPPVHPSQTSAANKPSKPNEDKSELSEDDGYEDEPKNPKSEPVIPTSMIIIFSVTGVALAGLGIYMFISGKKKKSKPQRHYEDDDAEFEDSEAWEIKEFNDIEDGESDE